MRSLGKLNLGSELLLTLEFFQLNNQKHKDVKHAFKIDTSKRIDLDKMDEFILQKLHFLLQSQVKRQERLGQFSRIMFSIHYNFQRPVYFMLKTSEETILDTFRANCPVEIARVNKLLLKRDLKESINYALYKTLLSLDKNKFVVVP